MPKISVLMPVYKTNEEHLRKAIESILAQTFTDYEFLILDDCPEDDRADIVKSYKDKRIKYSKNEYNLGITPSRNKLINMAKGEYLAVFDHDDISMPTRFEKEVKYLDEHPDVGVVSTQEKRMIKGNTSKYPVDNNDIKISLMQNCDVSHSASMLRKSVLTENNIHYEEEFSPAEDYALWCRLLKITKFHNIDEALLQYRDWNGNTSHLQKNKMQNKTFKIWSFVKNENPELYNEFLYKAEQITSIRLFNIIPLIKIKKCFNKSKIYLFNIFLIFSTKHKTRI